MQKRLLRSQNWILTLSRIRFSVFDPQSVSSTQLSTGIALKLWLQQASVAFLTKLWVQSPTSSIEFIRLCRARLNTSVNITLALEHSKLSGSPWSEFRYSLLKAPSQDVWSRLSLTVYDIVCSSPAVQFTLVIIHSSPFTKHRYI